MKRTGKRAIDNLTQFINEIQQSQVGQFYSERNLNYLTRQQFLNFFAAIMTFWRLIFCSKQKQEKRLQELEKSGKSPSSPEKRLKARSQTVDVEPTFNGSNFQRVDKNGAEFLNNKLSEACVDERAPAEQEHLPLVTKIENSSADCPGKRDDANPSQSTEGQWH